MLAPPQQPGGGAVVKTKPTIPTSEANKLKQQQQQQRQEQQQAEQALQQQHGPPDWLLEFDPKSLHYYFFNVRTGESRWAEEADFVAGGEEKGESEGHVLLSSSGRGMAAAAAAEEEEEEQETQSRGVVLVFTAMFLFHGCCVEGPLAALEGLLRSPFYLLGGLLLLLTAPCRREPRAAAARAGLWLREFALFAAAGLTLLVPGMALFAYRNFGPVSEEWDVAPIPTVLGAVDPRRFYVFCYGQGSVAGNAYYDADIGSMDALALGGDSTKKTILHPPRRLDIARAFVHTAELTSARQFEEEDDEEDDEEEAVLWTKQQPSQPQQSQQQKQQQAYTTVSSAGSVASSGTSTGAAAVATITPVVGYGQGHEEMKGGERFPRAYGYGTGGR